MEKTLHGYSPTREHCSLVALSRLMGWGLIGGLAGTIDDFCPTPGKYTATKREGSGETTLVMALVEDGCTARAKILTAAPAKWFGALN